MNTKGHPWIQRTAANAIYEKAATDDGSTAVYFVQAPAGTGKTLLARDIGTRLGSPTGYESSRLGKVVWSGILDIYDPDTNSNQGIERRLIEALAQKPSVDFEKYIDARFIYDAWFQAWHYRIQPGGTAT